MKRSERSSSSLWIGISAAEGRPKPVGVPAMWASAEQRAYDLRIELAGELPGRHERRLGHGVELRRDVGALVQGQTGAGRNLWNAYRPAMGAAQGESLIPTHTSVIETGVDHVLDSGFAHLAGPIGSPSEARALATRIASGAELRSPLAAGMPALVRVGEFVIPPEGAQAREFQVLHIDFGLPIDPHGPQDVARYTALHIPLDRAATSARTRIVRLAALLGQRRWPANDALIDRLVDYGSSRAARQGCADYVEGILARLVEAADEAEASLPRASERLCGQELGSIADERRHFAARGLRLEAAEVLTLRDAALAAFSPTR